MTLKKLTPLFTAAGLALAVASTGCSTTAGNPQAANQDRHFAGLVTIEPHSFQDTTPNTLELHVNDVINKPDMSGDRTTLLFGLITIEDY
jgi:hypothetical protein